MTWWGRLFVRFAADRLRLIPERPATIRLVGHLDISPERKAFVNYLGDSKDAASDAAKKLAATTKAENIPFVVPNEFENGPEDYGINAKAAITIIMAHEGKVKANHAFAKASELDVAAVIGDLKKILN